jgi:hypothetical protein
MTIDTDGLKSILGYVAQSLGMGSAELQVQLARARKALRDPTLEINLLAILC